MPRNGRTRCSTRLRIVIPTGVLATVIGTAAAVGLVRGNFPGRAAITGVLMAPLVVPIIVVGAAVYEFFGRLSLNGTWVGFVLAHTMITVPYVVSIVSASLSTVNDQYEKAALTLGAPPWTVFRRILFPLIAPAILSGMLFAMVVSFDELIVSLFISTPTFKLITVQMWSDVIGRRQSDHRRRRFSVVRIFSAGPGDREHGPPRRRLRRTYSRLTHGTTGQSTSGIARSLQGLWKDAVRRSRFGVSGERGIHELPGAIRLWENHDAEHDRRSDRADRGRNLPPVARDPGFCRRTKRDIGVVFQNYALFPHMTIAANLAFPLEMRRVSRSGIRTRVARALDMVELSGMGDRLPVNCPVASSNGSRWPGPWCSNRRCC